jgi:hypothetical protein
LGTSDTGAVRFSTGLEAHPNAMLSAPREIKIAADITKIL